MMGGEQPFVFAPRQGYSLKVPTQLMGAFAGQVNDSDGIRIVSHHFRNVSGVITGDIDTQQG